MAQLQLTCSCGWVLFVRQRHPQGIHCPKCGLEIGGSRASAWRARVAVTMGTILGLGLAFVMTWIIVRPGLPSSGPPAPPPAIGDGPTAPAPPTPDLAKPDTTEAGLALDRMASRQTLAGVVAEIFRQRGQPDRAGEVERGMASAEREIAEVAAGAPDRMAPERLRPGDRVSALGEVTLASLAAEARVELLAGALRSLQAGTTWRVVALRDGQALAFTAAFGVITLECSALVREGLAAAAPPKVADPPTMPAAGPLPADLLAAVRDRVLRLPPYYLQAFLKEERDRMEALVREGKGTAEDADFLTRAVTEVYADLADEMRAIKTQVFELHARVEKEGAPGDVVIKTDGTRLDGRLVEEGAESVRFEIVLGGSKGMVTIAKGDVKEIRRGAGPGAEFPAKLAAAMGKVADLEALARWCRERTLPLQRELVCYTILDLDPGHEVARTELGYEKGESGRWSRDRQARRAGNLIEYGGASYTPEQFAAMLKAQGHVEVGGAWYARRSWGFKAGSLQRDDARLAVTFENAAVFERVRAEKERVYDLSTRTYRDVTRSVILGRMIAPLTDLEPGSGTAKPRVVRRGRATVTIEAPGPFLECRVKAVLEVAAAGSTARLTVWNDEGQTREIANLSSVKRHDAAVDVSDLARGRRRVHVTAEMVAPFGDDNAQAMFLPGGRSDPPVLEVTAKIGEPLNAVNRILGVKVDPPRAAPALGDRDGAIRDAEEAAELVGAGDDLPGVLTKMRERTARLKFSGLPAALPEFEPLVKRLADPLVFDGRGAEDLDVPGWWRKLAPASRKRFAVYYALCCARARYLQGGPR